MKDESLKKRIRRGDVRRTDVVRRMAELAFGRTNDCVRLVLEDKPDIDSLDLSLLSEVKRNEKGTVEVKLIDRVRVLEQLQLAAAAAGDDLSSFLAALQDAGEDGQ